MTTTTVERPEEVENRNRATPEERRSTIVGWVRVALGLFVIFAFGFGAEEVRMPPSICLSRPTASRAWPGRSTPVHSRSSSGC